MVNVKCKTDIEVCNRMHKHTFWMCLPNGCHLRWTVNPFYLLALVFVLSLSCFCLMNTVLLKGWLMVGEAVWVVCPHSLYLDLIFVNSSEVCSPSPFSKKIQMTTHATEKDYAWLYFMQPCLFSMALWCFCECQRCRMGFKSPSWRMKPT